MVDKKNISYRRIKLEKVKKWAIASGLVGTPLAIVLFLFLQSLGAITITGYSGDMICSGTPDDLCYAYLNFTADTDVYIYPDINNSWMFSTDKKLKLLKLQRSWGTGWRTIYLNKTWNSKVKYAIKFSNGKDYKIRFVAEKFNSYEDIKWSFGEIDPTFKGIKMNYSVEDINKKTKKIKLNLDREYNLNELAKQEGKKPSDYLRLEKTKYFGDAKVSLKTYQNITRERIKSSYDCNCKNETYNFIENQTNKTTEKTREVCETCRIYENYTVSVLTEINPETFKINKNTEIFEVSEGCSKIEKLLNGKWGCSVKIIPYILGKKIE